MEPVWEKTPFKQWIEDPNGPRWVRVPLGDNDNESDGSKAEWCKQNVDPDNYKLRDVGFTWSDYVIDFRHESDATMFLLRWGVNSG